MNSRLFHLDESISVIEPVIYDDKKTIQIFNNSNNKDEEKSKLKKNKRKYFWNPLESKLFFSSTMSNKDVNNKYNYIDDISAITFADTLINSIDEELELKHFELLEKQVEEECYSTPENIKDEQFLLLPHSNSK